MIAKQTFVKEQYDTTWIWHFWLHAIRLSFISYEGELWTGSESIVN